MQTIGKQTTGIEDVYKRQEYPLFLKSASFLLWDVRRTYMLYIKAIFRQPPFNCRYFSCNFCKVKPVSYTHLIVSGHFHLSARMYSSSCVYLSRLTNTGICSPLFGALIFAMPPKLPVQMCIRDRVCTLPSENTPCPAATLNAWVAFIPISQSASLRDLARCV